jgi:hypothetical protein
MTVENSKSVQSPLLLPNPGKHDTAVCSVQPMWNGGPLRRWSATKTTKTPVGYSEGFVGSYVCASCMESCEGVYRFREPVAWLCGACRKKGGLSGGAR